MLFYSHSYCFISNSFLTWWSTGKQSQIFLEEKWRICLRNHLFLLCFYYILLVGERNNDRFVRTWWSHHGEMNTHTMKFTPTELIEINFDDSVHECVCVCVCMSEHEAETSAMLYYIKKAFQYIKHSSRHLRHTLEIKKRSFGWLIVLGCWCRVFWKRNPL